MWKCIVVILLCLFIVGCISQQDPTTDVTVISFDPNKIADIDATIAPLLSVASALVGIWPGWGWSLALIGAAYATLKKLKITIPTKSEKR